MAKFQEWLNSEYIEPKIDWSKIPIDTRIEFSDDKIVWRRCYFAGCSPCNTPTVFADGKTSWSSAQTIIKITRITKYVRFPDGEVEEIVELD